MIWAHEIVTETQAMGELLGGDQNGIYALLDKGFWDDDDIMDPETCGTGSIYLPIGPWATCKSSILSFPFTLLYNTSSGFLHGLSPNSEWPH